ncbi:hypothetical protein GGR50DRAFT_646169 [Xylaria sp. CBS 124048]|nr:hypothetical protein GGR50DRAFT_646169 [Xylaria sp. CBS 124048]
MASDAIATLLLLRSFISLVGMICCVVLHAPSSPRVPSKEPTFGRYLVAHTVTRCLQCLARNWPFPNTSWFCLIWLRRFSIFGALCLISCWKWQLTHHSHLPGFARVQSPYD